MNVNPFHIICKSEREYLAGNALRAAGMWCDEWFVAPVSVTVDVETERNDIRNDEHVSKNIIVGNRLPVILMADDDWEKSAGKWLCGAGSFGNDREEAASQSMGNGVLDRLLLSLVSRVFSGEQAVFDESSKNADEKVEHGSISLRFVFDGVVSFRLLISSVALESLLTSFVSSVPASGTAGTISKREAILNQRVLLQILLGQTELTLDELRTLVPGDVIKIDRKVHEPLVVQLDHDKMIAVGHLGTKGDRKAVQLTIV